jgi:predicted Zn-dependent peptidase
MFYDKTVLDNGISVITERMDTMRSVAIGIWFAVGSRDERYPDDGLSHFLEHMMFKGTPTRSAAEISQTFDRLGAELNAFTSKEYTCYYARVLDRHVPEAVEVLADMVVNSTFDDGAIASEREVVLEEISRTEDTPDDRVHELFARTLWPDHPLGRPVLGQRETISAADRTQSLAYKAAHYETGACVVAAAGDVDHAQLVALVREHLAGLPHGDGVKRLHTDPSTETRLEVLPKETEQAHICWGVPALKATDDDRFVLSVLDATLGGGMSSRLFQEIREKKGLAYAVYSYHSLYQDTGAYTVYAGTRPSNMEQVVRLVQAEVEKVKQDGITAEELDRAKESIKGGLVLGLESTRNRMTRLGKSYVTDSPILSIDELVERLDAVTGDAVTAMARKLFDGRQALSIIGPFDVTNVEHLLD